MPSRALFHNILGGFDFSRLLEQLIPTAAVGVIVMYGNSLISSYQVSNLKEQFDHSEVARVSMQAQLQSTNVELAKLNAQVVAFLGQQVTMNAAMDARLTYLERSREGGNVTVIQPSPTSSTTIQPRGRK